MKVKAIVISAVASFTILGSSAIPTFAASGNAESQSSNSVIAPYKLVDDYIYKKENVFANSFTKDGITWYLKGVTYSSGWYIGHYQANI
ncbi:LCI fold-containing protein [Cytobacillus horneckiae]|uniref:LCI fold-containing protein n=1 Tax=Cytobacillus horneckiae TaxID=549687 RepID=UPI0039A03B8E